MASTACRLLLLALLATPRCPAIAQSAAVAPTAYFRQDWCPTAAQIEALEQFSRLEINGCCVRRAFPLDPTGFAAGLLTPYRQFVLPAVDPAACTGSNAEVQAAAQAALLRDREAAAQRLRDLPRIVGSFSDQQLCVAVGLASRAHLPDSGPLAKELTKRRLVHSAPMTQAERIRVGVKACQVYAALGAPIRRYRTTTAASVDEHLIFAGGSVRMRDGVVYAVHD